MNGNSACQKYGVLNKRWNYDNTIIKEIILGPKIGNGYDKVPYMYWKLQRMSEGKDIRISQSSIEYV